MNPSSVSIPTSKPDSRFARFAFGCTKLLVVALLALAVKLPAEELPLDNLWRFSLDVSDTGEKSGWAAANFDDHGWQDMEAARSWVVAGYPDYSGVAWYRKRIEIPDRFRGKFLRFTSVVESCIVYFDGVEVGRHGPNPDPAQQGITPGAGPWRVRLPADRAAVMVALRVTGRSTHRNDYTGPGLVGYHHVAAYLSDETLMQWGGYWLAPDRYVTRDEWIKALRDYRQKRRAELGVDGRIYQNEFAWVSRNFAEGFVFASDTSFYDVVHGRYRMDEFLDEGERRFGGYDSLLLWHSYPNIGVDAQNQFEMLRNLPGGIPGLAAAIGRAHARGVKVFIPYNPWDKGTTHPSQPVFEEMAAVIAELDADGVILDVSGNVPHVELRQAIDRKRLGVSLQPEGGGGDSGIVTINNSWSQYAPIAGFSDRMSGIPVSKWTDPRHTPQADGDRWRHDRTSLLQDAFLNGTGVMIWEDVFGTWNRFTDRDAALLRRMLPIQRHCAALLTNDAWEPLVPTLFAGVEADFWPGQDRSLWTLANWSNDSKHGDVLRVRHAAGTRYFDLYHGVELHPRIEGAEAVLALDEIEPRGIGAILAQQAAPDASLQKLLAQSRQLSATPLAHFSSEWQPAAPPRIQVEPKTRATPANTPPADMVLMPETKSFRMSIEHNLGEGSCYPDASVDSWERRSYFMYEGGAHTLNILHQVRVAITPFFIDRTLVTKRAYQRFLTESGYRPADLANFLRDWDWSDAAHPKPPAGLEEHPVVWVSLEDARAYAHWAGKRLPTEAEWQYAAAGLDQRHYPWGDTWQSGFANDNGTATSPVTAFPQGRTPKGVYDMSGNVWQWTESERDDGNRYAMLRGGSYYQAAGAAWYFDRFLAFSLAHGEHSARPTNYHVKFFLMGPSADRKATIGFRCVADAMPAPP